MPSSIKSDIEQYAKDAAALQEKLRGYVEKWSWLVTNYGWKFDAHYCMAAEDMPEGFQDAYAMCSHKFNYLLGDIYFNLRALKELEDAHAEEIVIHEIVHMLLSAYREDEERGMEYVTTTVARAFKGLSDAS